MYVRPTSTRLLRGTLTPAMRAMEVPYPCRCLWRGFWQITRTAPWRRMILHFSHMGLTDGRTFMFPFGWIPAPRLWPPVRLPLPRRVMLLAAKSTPDRARPGMVAISGRRPLGVLVPGGEDSGPLGGDRHGELEVGGQRAVLGEDRPVVVAHAHAVAPGGDHGLDGQHHALLQVRPPPGLAEVGDLGVLVHVAADPLAHQRAHDREA